MKQHNTLRYTLLFILLLGIAGLTRITLFKAPKKSDLLSSNAPLEKKLQRAAKAIQLNEFQIALDIIDHLLTLKPHWKDAETLRKQALFERKNFALLQPVLSLKKNPVAPLTRWKHAHQQLEKLQQSSQFYSQAQQEQRWLLAKLKDMAEIAGKNDEIEKMSAIRSLLLLLSPGDEPGSPPRRTAPQPSNPPRRTIRRRRYKMKRRRRRVRPRRILRKEPLFIGKVPPPRKILAAPPVRRPPSQKVYCRTLYDSGSLRRADNCYRTIVKEHPLDATAHFMLGTIHSRLGHCSNQASPRYEAPFCFRAAKYFARFIKLAPNSPQAKKLKKMLGVR